MKIKEIVCATHDTDIVFCNKSNEILRFGLCRPSSCCAGPPPGLLQNLIETKSSTSQPASQPASSQPASLQAASQPASQPASVGLGTVFFTRENNVFDTFQPGSGLAIQESTLPDVVFCNKSKEILLFWLCRPSPPRSLRYRAPCRPSPLKCCKTY